MKRSTNVKLVLLGGLALGGVTACAPTDLPPHVSAQSVYPNNYYLPGAGYYHAPFHGFFPRPYNTFDPVQKKFYFGGQWGAVPFESVINLSSPTPAAALAAEAARSDIVRGGFGGTAGSHGYHVWA